MPSLGSSRRIAEHLLRGLSVGALAWMLWLSLDRDVPPVTVSARSGSIGDALREWTTSSVAPARIDIRLDSAPSPLERGWTAAVRGAGSDVRWSGTVAGSGISVQQVVSPKKELMIVVAAPDSSVVTLSDELGIIDSVRAAGAGASFAVPAATGTITARVNGTATRAAMTDSVTIRRLLVIGAAGWESKFVIAALEEDGWNVDADIRVAPGINVNQGPAVSPDTSRYAAVIALDASAATRARQINAYVQSGGGLILAGRAAVSDAFAEMRAATVANAGSANVPALVAHVTTLKTLALAPLLNPTADAIVLDRRAGTIAAAARRHGAGRVLQHGYADTWRWRMSGGDRSVDEHRTWWTGAVSRVAYAPRTVLPAVEDADVAPLASLTAALGPASALEPAGLAGGLGSISMWWFFALLSVSLVLELASRRIRGAR